MYNLTAKKALFIIFGIMAISFSLYLPKIFLVNNIYYTSRDINNLYAHFISLQEENKFLAQQLEDMKFKNQIIDSLLFNPLAEKND